VNIGLTPVGGIIKDMERIDKASYNLIGNEATRGGNKGGRGAGVSESQEINRAGFS